MSSPSPNARSLSLQTKLLGAIALGLALIVLSALAGLGSAWANLTTDVPPEVARNADAERLSREFRVEVQEWKNVLLRGADAELREKHLAAFDARAADVDALASGLAGDAGADARTRELAADFAAAHTTLGQNYHQALQAFADAGYDPRSGDTLVRGMDRAPGATLEALGEHTAAVAAAAVAGKSVQARRVLAICAIVLASAALLLMVALAWWLRRNVIQPVLQVEAAARAVARGDLDQHLVLARRGDEIGRLGDAMQQATTTLRAVLQAQADMASRHEQGQISYRMDASAFPGAYSHMVSEANALVDAHIQLNRRAIAIMDRYAVGDLREDMEDLPGEKAAVTTALATVKHNLATINGEISRLAGAAALGDFSVRGDAQRFEHDFGEMIGGLNALMQTTERDLGAVSSVLQAIARGDLTAQMRGEYHGVFARMRDDANQTVTQLSTIVAGIKQAAASIDTAAGEIATGNNDLSRRTEQQAANLEETAASMEELTSTVRQNADHARQANQLAIGAGNVAAQGGDVVSQVVTTMGGIETSSKRIAEIIGVIDGIAFQTNILALNAAVEAARAGDQGRGFAVVASEVRTLAQRSAAAAKEIKDLIDDSVGKVADGSMLVQRAGTTMAEIVASVQRVTDIMGEISAASQEQTAGIEQVNQTVIQMDESTQQNAALVEEATAAARAMEQQARELTAAVDVFVMADVAAGPHAAEIPAAGAGRSGAGASSMSRTMPTTPKTSSSSTMRSEAQPARATSRPLPAATRAATTSTAATSDGDWHEF